MKKSVFIFLIFCLACILHAQQKEILISHMGFTLSYNEKYVQSNWVAYDLTKEKTNKICERADKFTSDPKLTSKMATNKDYSHSGYDRGHLAPAADMGWSPIAMKESFYFSNVSPQLPSFNRGIWKKLETLVRAWAIEYDTIFIVTGPILKDGLPTIGENKVAIPSFFYKVILDRTHTKGIGFVIPADAINQSLQNFAVTIDSVERLSGINFFPSLPNDLEERIEQNICVECWEW